MKPAYFKSHNSSRDRWMVSYLDVLTILLILFVAMAAQTLQTSRTKPGPASVPVAAPAVQEPSAALTAIQQELEKRHLDVQQDSRGVVVSLPQGLLFAPGEDRINPEAMATVSAIGHVLNTIPNNVSLVGHTDAVPIHNRRFANNWELAAGRSLRLLEMLSSRYGIAESRLSVPTIRGTQTKRPTDGQATVASKS